MAKEKLLPTGDYASVLSHAVQLVEAARRTSARTVNSIMTATYREIGRRIVEVEQGGTGRVDYGDELIRQLSGDLSKRFGRGFGIINLTYMRRFFTLWPLGQIQQTPSVESAPEIVRTLSEQFSTLLIAPEEEIKDPLVLEFLDLKDEYSESDLEEALVRKLEDFLLELGGDFAFIGRQRCLRIGDEWYRIDLL